MEAPDTVAVAKGHASDLAALIGLLNNGELTEVVRQGFVMAKRHPGSVDIHNVIGVANAMLADADQAVIWFDKALRIDGRRADVHNNLGRTLLMAGRADQAAHCFEHALEIDPAYADAHNNLGNALKDLGRFSDAIACYRRCLAIDPSYAEVLFNLGTTWKAAGHPDEAIACFRQVIALKPGFADAHFNLGNALKEYGDKTEAIGCYMRAIAIRPDFAEAHFNLGNTCKLLWNSEAAISCYRRTLELDPNCAEAHNNLGSVLAAINRKNEALACYERALEIRPDYEAPLSFRLYQAAEMCDWDAIAAYAHRLPALGTGTESVAPFGMFALEDEPARHRLRSENLARSFSRVRAPHFARPAVMPERLRIGYFSPDLHDHPIIHLTAGMFGAHDRERFEVRIYSYGADPDHPLAARVKNAADAFTDVRMLSDREIAERARRERLDIAVDLTGWTRNARLGIFAQRAAPIQMGYLGFPGTTGAEFIDYLIADRFVVPPEQRCHYAEKVILMPDTYMVTDDQRVISANGINRRDAGLPEDAFVFCCFNNTAKIGPREFDIWMRLLARVEDSVLWLRANQWAMSNLRKEASKRGIDPARLVFAQRVSQGDHLARHRLADLFLDTFNFNAHTTTTDALWAGLPVLTKPGKSFAARVAGSLLHAVGLPELIAATEEEYEGKALAFATDPIWRSTIQDKLSTNRTVAPLFDTRRFVAHLQSAYRQAYARYVQQLPPEDIVVKPD